MISGINHENGESTGMFHYGAQYFRPPTPRHDQWRKDFEKMREANFNTVKFWPMWRWNNPSEGVFVWDELDKLMDLSEEFELNVVLNVIFDTAPAWFLRKHPDCLMVSADGQIARPKAPPCRQTGGANAVCFHYAEYQKRSCEFLKRTVSHFVNHPALYAWDLWNEPWLTGGFDNSIGGSFCFCDSTATCFREKMQQKYQTIAQLNDAWSRNYQSFDEVELPRSKGTLTDNLDFRRFMVDTVSAEMKRRVRTAREIDSRHLLMSHSAIATPNTDPISMANDDWALSEGLDIYGASAGGYGREQAFSAHPRYEDLPYEVCCVRNAAGGKRVWVPEFHAFDGMAAFSYGTRSLEHLMRWVAPIVAGGAEGVLYWQYRPELLGLEAPAWGVAEPDGSSGVHFEHVKRIGKMLEDYSEQISNATKPPADVALLYSLDNALYSWLIDKPNYWQRCLKGVFRAFYDKNFVLDVVNVDYLQSLSRYKLVYFPFPVVLNEAVAKTLQDYVRNGGTLVAEACLGSFRSDNGFHETSMPGFGFSALFDCKRAQLLQGGVLDHGSLGIVTRGGHRLQGDFARETLQTTHGDAIAQFADGSPAIVRGNCEEGSFILIGTCLGPSVDESNSYDLGHFLADIADQAGCSRSAVIETNSQVRVDLLPGTNYKILALVNHGKRKAKVSLELERAENKVVNMLTGEVHTSKGKLTLSLAPESGDLFYLAHP